MAGVARRIDGVEQRAFPRRMPDGHIDIVDTNGFDIEQVVQHARVRHVELCERQVHAGAALKARPVTERLQQMALAGRGPAPYVRLPRRVVRFGQGADGVYGVLIDVGVVGGESRAFAQPYVQRKLMTHRAPADSDKPHSIYGSRPERASPASTDATGSASSTPKKPNSCPPASTAKITITGWIPMRSPTSQVVSTIPSRVCPALTTTATHSTCSTSPVWNSIATAASTKPTITPRYGTKLTSPATRPISKAKFSPISHSPLE